MRKIIFLFLTFFLTSCSLFQDKNSQIVGTESATLYTGSGFSVMVPSTWSSSGQIDLLPTPAHGSVILASKSPEKKYNFSNNFLIIKDRLDGLMTSAAYSEINNVQTTRKYLQYSPVKTADILFKDGDSSKAYVFDAQYNSNTPRVRFVQTAKIC